ncbi:ATP-grasp domain-containing protein [Anaerocolumna sp. AGMB13025]|uniref:D-alanine--D-alanine ligase family protein n=1 Tax=Anaerocolumna sp. AGMB13025 TaxID=3039116 RepID=UPI0024203820|nr:ATP-grasp domain-containing protein [Anaerocolumna sp. AGMB13025]WFR57959.1 ATP-grasp domain-containing protein [Anaerocolumna sp. AGMB13025]
MKIVVLAGGLSPEREVSLSSGSLIANSLMESGHEVLLLDVYEGFQDYVKDLNQLFSKPWEGKKYSYTVSEQEPDLNEIKKRNNNQAALIGKNVLELCRLADVVFIALHGSMGENGQIQATFDNFDIKYTGTGYIGSLLAMDKDLTKKLLVQAGIPTADWILYDITDKCFEKSSKYDTIINGNKIITDTTSNACNHIIDSLVYSPMDDNQVADSIITESQITDSQIAVTDLALRDYSKITGKIGFPCVIKPLSCGSSIGVSIVNNTEELEKALHYAAAYEKTVLVEKMIRGREFSVGILDKEALPVIEIIPIQGFYDYKNKYQGGLTKEVCPADLSPELTAKLQNLALGVHKTLRLGDYSRIDFILDESGEFICLEANTLPGMTPTSLIPQEAKSKGISYNELVCTIARLPFKN